MNRNRPDDQLVASGWRSNAVASHNVQTVQRNGREYLQFPLVPLTEMVLNYPENGTKEYLPAESIRETAGLWDGTLLTYVHPENRTQTVRDPDEFMGSVIGAFHDPRILDGGEKLKGNGLIDVEKATDLGGSAAELVELLRRGEQVSVSAGYATTDDEYRSGRFDGEGYDLVQGPPLPDHIAVFPSDSQMRARCSPEDGCAAPRANASQDGQHANQRAASGVRRNMSEIASNGDSSVFPNSEERDKAVRAVQREMPNTGPEFKDEPDDVILRTAQIVADYQLPGCDCGESETCECRRDNARRQSSSRSHSQSRSSRRANMTAVPGQMNRDVERDRGRERENASSYPSGGRSNWEKRKLGLDDVSDDDDLPPAGGRSAWEKRKTQHRRANSTSADSADDAGDSYPTGSRSSFEQRQNATVDVDEQEWLDHQYPLTAKRKAQERAEKRRRWNNLREQARRNDTNTVRSRHNDSS